MQLCLWSVHIKVKFCFDCEPHTHTTSNKSFFVKSPKIFSCIQTLNFKTLLPSWLGIWSPQINDSVHRLYQVTQRYCSELIHRKRCNSIRVHISGVTKCVTKFLTLSQWGLFDSVKNFVTHFVTPEIWILRNSSEKSKLKKKPSWFRQINLV